MICKWCGESLKPGVRTCRRCKRELPALSDCGGFYDLVTGSVPVSSGIPETPPAPPAPIQPELPQRKQSRLLPNVICAAAIVLALIFLIQTVSLSGKLADATEEADRLRGQLKSKEEISTTDSTDPTINGFDQKDPEPTGESDALRFVLKDGEGIIELNAAQNARLNKEILHFALCYQGQEDPVMIFTLQRRSGAEGSDELYLQITQSDGIAIHTVDWHSSRLVEIPADEEEGLGFGHIFTASDPITEFTKPVEELGEGKNTCTLTGTDASGEELTITICDIVIE